MVYRFGGVKEQTNKQTQCLTHWQTGALIERSTPVLSPMTFPLFWYHRVWKFHMYRAHSCTDVYGSFLEIHNNVWYPESHRTSVHDNFNPCTDKCKSVHGNLYICTFYVDYCIKMAIFLPFFVFFFWFFTNILSKFSHFAQIYNIYSMISNEFLII